jgi:hypothetical protein
MTTEEVLAAKAPVSPLTRCLFCGKAVTSEQRRVSHRYSHAHLTCAQKAETQVSRRDTHERDRRADR